MSGAFEGRESRKRRRVSERRRVFGRLGLSDQQLLSAANLGSLSTEQSSWSASSSSTQQQGGQAALAGDDQAAASCWSSRSDSPLADNSKISMKIQFHITVAPENEPLILELASPQASHHQQQQANNGRKKSIESIGEHIHERLLSRQNTASTRRRQQLLAMHNQSVQSIGPSSKRQQQVSMIQSDDNLAGAEVLDGEHGREPAARSSTISGSMADEATLKFLASHQSRPAPVSGCPPQVRSNSGSFHNQPEEREHIFFKRDGQRFGHEFTLKLAVERTYRCLIKVRPLIPLQAISVQGHQVLFVDCSAGAACGAPAGGGGSAPASSSALNNSWRDIRTNDDRSSNIHYRRIRGDLNNATNNIPFTNQTRTHHHHHHHHHSNNNNNHSTHNQQQQRLQHAKTTGGLDCLYQQQQSQMMRHFAASHCSISSSSPHLGSQLIYMFDWSASRFEVTKNKARTQVQTVLKFKNGQILSLPLQVKFYQSECRQHLNWGSQLHFIDYDCNINNMGQMSVDRIQYY